MTAFPDAGLSRYDGRVMSLGEGYETAREYIQNATPQAVEAEATRCLKGAAPKQFLTSKRGKNCCAP